MRDDEKNIFNKNADEYMAIIKLLAKRKDGMTRTSTPLLPRPVHAKVRKWS